MSASQEASTAQLSLAAIASYCRHETQKFLTHQANNPAFCFELFRRALMHPPHGERDAAWGAVYTQYHLQLVTAAQRHPLIHQVGDSAETIADHAFTKMYQSFANDPQKFGRFEHLGGLIRFLQACVHSIIVDACRRQRAVVDVPDALASPAQALTEVESAEFWQAIRKRVQDQQEACVVYGCFELGLPARKVYDLYPDQFDNVKQVYRINERLLRRLRRDEALLSLLSAYRGN